MRKRIFKIFFLGVTSKNLGQYEKNVVGSKPRVVLEMITKEKRENVGMVSGVLT